MSSCSSIICRAHISTNSTKMVFKTVQWTVIPFQFRLVVFFMAFTICVLDAMCPARRLIWLYFSFIYCWQSSDAVTIVTDVAFWCVENVGKASNRNINFRLLVWIIEQQIVPATLPHQPPSPVTILQKNDEICRKDKCSHACACRVHSNNLWMHIEPDQSRDLIVADMWFLFAMKCVNVCMVYVMCL